MQTQYRVLFWDAVHSVQDRYFSDVYAFPFEKFLLYHTTFISLSNLEEMLFNVLVLGPCVVLDFHRKEMEMNFVRYCYRRGII